MVTSIMEPDAILMAQAPVAQVIGQLHRSEQILDVRRYNGFRNSAESGIRYNGHPNFVLSMRCLDRTVACAVLFQSASFTPKL